MRALSEARVEAMALAIMDAIKGTPGLAVSEGGRALATVAQCIRDALGGAADLDGEIRQRIGSLSRPVPEGSREWDILYRQYSDELRRRRG